jgi:hypothetical protein
MTICSLGTSHTLPNTSTGVVTTDHSSTVAPGI